MQTRRRTGNWTVRWLYVLLRWGFEAQNQSKRMIYNPQRLTYFIPNDKMTKIACWNRFARYHPNKYPKSWISQSFTSRTRNQIASTISIFLLRKSLVCVVMVVICDDWLLDGPAVRMCATSLVRYWGGSMWWGDCIGKQSKQAPEIVLGEKSYPDCCCAIFAVYTVSTDRTRLGYRWQWRRWMRFWLR